MSSENRSFLIESLMKEVRLFIAAVILFNEKVAASVGLNGTDLQFIHLLELKVASTPGDLARWSGLTTGGVTVVLDRLEKRGFIRRLPNPSDRRSVIVEPVASKLRKFQPVYQSKGDQLFNALSQSSDRELRIILDFFQRTTRAGETPGREPKSI